LLKQFVRPNHATVVSYAALFVALGGSAYAVTHTSSTVIHACYAQHTGALRLLRSGHCGRDERAVSWNKRGPQGPAGTVDTSRFYTKTESDGRYLPLAGTAANSSQLGGQAPSAFAAASLFGSPASVGSGTSGDSSCILGEIKLTASSSGVGLPSNWLLAHGQALQINQNQALFALLGTTYGGDGVTTFDLPNLQGAEPKGAGPAGANYAICITGIFP
jgi:hypothetical protein